MFEKIKALSPMHAWIVKDIIRLAKSEEDSIEVEICIENILCNGCKKDGFDTLKFFSDFKDDINKLVSDLHKEWPIDFSEMSGFDKSDMLCFGQNNKHFLACLCYEEVVHLMEKEYDYMKTWEF